MVAERIHKVITCWMHQLAVLLVFDCLEDIAHTKAAVIVGRGSDVVSLIQILDILDLIHLIELGVERLQDVRRHAIKGGLVIDDHRNGLTLDSLDNAFRILLELRGADAEICQNLPNVCHTCSTLLQGLTVFFHSPCTFRLKGWC